MNPKYLALTILALQSPAFAQNAATDTVETDNRAENAASPEPVAPESVERDEAPAEPPAQESVSPSTPGPKVESGPVGEEENGGEALTAPPVESAVAIGTSKSTVDATPTALPTPEANDTINPRPAGEEELMGSHPVDFETVSFKPGSGLSFKSKDESFSMAIRLRVQFRDELTSEDEDGVKTLSNAFGIRRARLQFKGNVFSKHVKYKAEFALSPRDLSLQNGATAYTPLLSWYTDFTYLRDLSLRVGQYKLLYSRQRVISSGDQEFVDRNIAQNEFNLDRDIGAHLFSSDLLGLDLFRYYLGMSIGEGRDVYEAEETSGNSVSYQPLVRLEVLPFGDFEDYSEVEFERLDKFRLSFGAAYAYLKNGTRTRGYQGSTFADDGTVDYHNATADMMIKWAGMTVFSDFFYREGHRNIEVAPGDEDGNLARNGLGGSVQVGYLIPRIPVGVGLRYGGVSSAGFDSDETALSDSQEIGGTMGWYMAGHNLKLQADYFHTWGDDFSTNAVDEGRVQLQVAY